MLISCGSDLYFIINLVFYQKTDASLSILKLCKYILITGIELVV